MKTNLKKIQQEEHLHCLLCGQNNKRGLKLDFRPTDDGGIETSFECSKTLQGYKDIIHGGVISALLDSVMTNCLFAHGIKAFTAELNTRFLTPVRTKGAVTLRANIEKSSGSYYILKASLTQGQTVKAKATGKFIAFFKNAAVKNVSAITKAVNAT
jgi:acyl-coenzyme A thioesterase PaaI-like protein